VNAFKPKLEILPESQRDLWPDLNTVPSDFVLYGGTALALQIGHRTSEDFDFFATSGFDPDHLQSELPFFCDLPAADRNVWVQRKPNTLEGYVPRAGGSVKVAFFGGLDNLRRVEDPRHPVGSTVQVASLIDLAGMKMRVVQARASWKDYMDIHALASNGVDVPTALAAARAIDSRFNPAVSVRALQFFDDGTLNRIPASVRKDLVRMAQAVDFSKLPHLPSTAGLSPGGRNP
jgi:Nucleotidyl transferase AbiEii toxin, Type IV TA system